MPIPQKPRPQTPADGIAWVTGASSGLGRAVVLELVRRGWKVAISARRTEALAQLQAQHPDRIVIAPADVTDAEGVEAVVAGIEAQHGPIAFAYLNAGVSIFVEATRFDLAAIRQIVEVNNMGVYHCLAALLPRMIARQNGQIAICASVAGYGGLPRAAPYCASKAAMISAAMSLRFECDRQGILMQVVNPGFVDTPMTQKNTFPMPFMLKPEEAARACVNGFARRGFEITFPKRFSYLLKILNSLPYDLYQWLVAKGAGR